MAQHDKITTASEQEQKEGSKLVKPRQQERERERVKEVLPLVWAGEKQASTTVFGIISVGYHSELRVRL